MDVVWIRHLCISLLYIEQWVMGIDRFVVQCCNHQHLNPKLKRGDASRSMMF